MAKQHTPEEKIEIARLVCEKYATGDFTLDSCAENQGISARTFKYWCKEVSEIASMYKDAGNQAKEKQRNNLKRICFTSLMRLVEGYYQEDVTQDGVPVFDANGNQIGIKVKSIRRTKRYFPPSTTAVIFALKAMEPETFKDNMPPGQAEEQVFLIGGREVKF